MGITGYHLVVRYFCAYIFQTMLLGAINATATCVGEWVCGGGNNISLHIEYNPVGGRAGIVSTEKGKDGIVIRRYGEYVRCKVYQAVSLNVRTSRCGQSNQLRYGWGPHNCVGTGIEVTGTRAERFGGGKAL